MNEDQWGLKKKNPTKWPFFSVKKNIFQCFNNNKNTINFSFQQDLHFPPPLPSTSSHYLPRKESNNLPIFNSLKLFNASGIVNPLILNFLIPLWSCLYFILSIMPIKWYIKQLFLPNLKTSFTFLFWVFLHVKNKYDGWKISYSYKLNIY